MSYMYPNRKQLASDFVSYLGTSNNSLNRNNQPMSNRIKEFRLKLGMSQEDVAKKVGATRATIMKLEKGTMNLTTTWMDKLATKAFHCEPQELIGAPKERGRLGEGEIAVIYTLKAILKILLQKNLTSPKALDAIFSHALHSYEDNHLQIAAMVVGDLRKYAAGSPPESEKEVIRKLLELAPLGSA